MNTIDAGPDPTGKPRVARHASRARGLYGDQPESSIWTVHVVAPADIHFDDRQPGDYPSSTTFGTGTYTMRLMLFIVGSTVRISGSTPTSPNVPPYLMGRWFESDPRQHTVMVFDKPATRLKMGLATGRPNTADTLEIDLYAQDGAWLEKTHVTITDTPNGWYEYQSTRTFYQIGFRSTTGQSFLADNITLS
jgi:hypothetical protein